MIQRSIFVARLRNKAARVLAGSVAVLFAVPSLRAANTQSTFTAGIDLTLAGDWTPGLPTVTVDAILDTGFPTAPATLTISGASLTMGSLNDLNNQAITISNKNTGSTASTLTLGGATSGGDTVTGSAATDLIYLGGTTSNLTIKGPNDSTGSGVLGVTLGSNGDFDVFNSGATLNISAVIAGGFNLNKTGAGTLTLSGTNTFGGTGKNFTLTAGTLNINKAAALGNVSNAFIINGGVIDNTSGAAITTSNYAQTWNADFTFLGGTGTTHDLNFGTGAVSLGTVAGTSRTITTNAGTLTIGGPISIGSTATSLIKAGAGTLVLGGANTLTGGVTISAGTLIAAVSNATTVSGALGPSSVAATLGATSGSSNASLLATSVTVSNAINVAAGSTGNTLTLGNSTATTSPTFSGALSLGHDLAVVAQGTGTITITLSGTISGSGNLNASGSTGSLVLSGASSTYSGSLSFGGTQLSLNDVSSLGGSTGTFTFSGQKLDNSSGGNVTLTSNKAIALNSDFTYLASRNLTFGTGAVTLGNNRVVTVNSTISGGGLLTFGGGFGDGGSGYSLTKAGIGTLTLNGANTYSGATIVTGGVVNLVAAASTLANTTSVSVSGGAINLGVASGTGVANRINSAASLTLGGATGSGTFQINAGATVPVNSQTFTTLAVGTGSNQLSSSSAGSTAGTITFSGAAGSTYSRSIGGTVRFLGLATSSLFTNGPTGSSTIGTGTSAILIGAVAGTGSNVATDFVQATGGILAAPTYTANTWGSGLNTDVTASFTAAAGSTQSLRFNSFGGLTVTLAGTSTIDSGGILVSSNANFGVNSIITGGTLQAASGQDLWVYTAGNVLQDLTINSLIGDNNGSSLTKSGGRKLTLTNAANSYTGGTYLNEGILNITSGGTLGALSGALNFYGSATLQVGAASVDLSTRAINIAANQTATFDTNGNALLSGGVISGGGSLTKAGNGVLTLTGANTYTGTTNALRGTVRLDFSAAGAPASNILSSASQLLFGQYLNGNAAGSSTVEIQGKANTANTQTFASTVFGRGAGHLNLTAGSGTGTLAVNLGFLGRNTQPGVIDAAAPQGSTLDISYGSGVTVTTTTTTTTNGILAPSSHAAVTVNGNTWAALSGNSIVPYTGYLTSASYITTPSSTANLDVSGSSVNLSTTLNTMRFNDSAAPATINLAAGNVRQLTAGGILVTPNVGTNLSTIGTGLLAGAGRRDLIIIQNNTIGDLEIDSTITDIAAGAQNNTKSGAGKVILTASNTNTGNTQINEGTVVVTGDVVSSFTKTATSGNNSTTLNMTDTSNIFLGQAVTGGNLTVSLMTYTVVAINPGASVTLSSASNTSGGASGTFTFGGAAGLGVGATVQHVIAPGATLQIGNGGTTGSLLSTQTIQNNGTLVLNRSNDLAFNNVISGAGALEKRGAGIATIGGANSNTGDTRIYAGTLLTGVAGALASSTLDYDNYGGAISFGSLTAATLGGLKGSQNLLVANASNVGISLTVGGNNQDTTYSGNLTAPTGYTNPTLLKAGLGALTLSGINTYSGSTFINAGTFNVTGTLGTLANQTGKITGNGNSIINLSGSVVTNSYLGAGDGTYSTVNVTGGTVTLTGSGAGIFIGTGATGGGVMSISGGKVTLTNTAYISVGGGGTNGAGTNAPGTLNISGTGQLDTGTTTGVFHVGSSTAANTTGTGTVNLDGGVLATNRPITAGTVAASTFNFNGGIFRANGSATTMSGLTTAQVRNGGAIFDTQSFSVAIAQPLLHSTIAGDNATDGGLTKTGSGTLTLNGINTYTGATTVSQGTLLISGSIAGSTASVASASTLGGTGTVGGVTVASGATLEGGVSTTTADTLTSGGDVSLTDGSLIKLTLDAGGAHSTLARTGGAWSFDLNQAFSFSLLAGATATTYNDIITGLTGSETGLSTIGTWTIQNPGVTGAFTYDSVNHSVDLTLAAVPEASPMTMLLGAFGSLLGLQRFRRRAIR